MTRHTVVLAEDHALVRTGMRALVHSFDSYEVVAEAGNVADARRLLAQHRPDLLLLDVTLPDGNGIAALPELKALSADTRVLVLSMHESDDIVLAAFRAGADGYLPKSSAADELEFALDAVRHGRTYLSPTIARGLVDQALAAGAASLAAGAASLPAGRPDESPPADLLTARQLEVLKLVVAGRSMKEIAFDLDLSIKTVETHRAQIMDRLGIRDLPRLVLYAVRHGVVSADRT